jgi:hypothetical protein
MAEKVDPLFAELVAKHGAPETITELCPVPASDKARLSGAELACRHIADGTAAGPRLHIVSLRGRRTAACDTCLKQLQKQAAAKGVKALVRGPSSKQSGK